MTPLAERKQVINWIDEAVKSGARLEPACNILGLCSRTVQRWRSAGDEADKRPEAERPAPPHQLSEAERQAVLQVCNEPRFSHLSPTQIVPKLADEGVYLASESTFYRILKAEDQLAHRGRSEAPKRNAAPTTHTATQANQVWSWDITYLPSRVKGQFFYLYLIMDIYSRKIVGWEVYESESGELASQLVERVFIAERCFKKPMVLHSDNGSPMKSFTFQAKLVDLGIAPSYSRPRVSNDNPYSESLFKTLKYHHQWPSQGFLVVDEARTWVKRFVAWYNEEHGHSQIQFVTPAQRHRGEDVDILAKRQQVYQAAKAQNPRRWSGKTRDWTPAGDVALNPEKPAGKPAEKRAA